MDPREGRVDMALKRDFFVLGQDEIVVEAVLDQRFEIDRFFRQINAARLELGEIQEVVNEI